MSHIRPVSRRPALAQGTDLLETVILFLFTGFFSDWDNFSSVIQNLQKYYQKTR